MLSKQIFSRFGLRHLSVLDGVVTQSNPFKVQVLKQDNNGSEIPSIKGRYVILYKKPESLECVFANKGRSQDTFSLFRLKPEVEGEARDLFNTMNLVISLLADTNCPLYKEEKLQVICDTVRKHPQWTSAHVAAHLGLHEAFGNPELQSQLDTRCPLTAMTPLMVAIVAGHQKCVEEMLLHEARIGLWDMNGRTAYHYAVQHLPEVIQMLMKNDKSRVFDWVDDCGHTPLYKVCREKRAQNIGEKLDLRQDLKQRFNKGVDQYIMRKGPTKCKKSEIVRVLLEGGADPSIAETDFLPLHVAVELEELKCIELILNHDMAQRNVKDKRTGNTPLHIAKTKQVTELLVRLGCDVNAVNNAGRTPLIEKTMEKNSECVMELLTYGADCNIADLDGNTPLHYVIKNDDIDLMKVFIVFGADVNKVNDYNQSPRHLAATSQGKNNDDLLSMLHMSGADRCSNTMSGCSDGCSSRGIFNGRMDEKFKHLLTPDKSAEFDEKMCSLMLRLQDKTSRTKGDRVLCLDGGGIKGISSIQILNAIEKEAGVPVKNLFDWIGGSSTGGILALGIGIGRPLWYIQGLYFRLKDEVFKGRKPYKSVTFESFLKREFGETCKMSDIKGPKVIVTGVLADRSPIDLHLFRSYEPTLDKPRKESTNENTLLEEIKPPTEQLIWKSARCTGAAPSYFRTFEGFMDGGVMANNPTLDILTEIQEYYMGLLEKDPEAVNPLQCVISVGCGKKPITPRENIDVFIPGFSVTELVKAFDGAKEVISLLIDQAVETDGQPVDRARAWCSMNRVPFVRLSAQKTEETPIDCTDNKKILDMMWETHCYIVANKSRIQQVASLLKQDCEQSKTIHH